MITDRSVMYTLEEFQESVEALEDEYKIYLPLSFFEEIASPWFNGIFPVKSEMYGVEGLQRLGPMHAVAEFAGCYYRWRRMVKLEYTMSFDGMMNAIHDAFGYAVIMRVMAGCEMQWETIDKTKSPNKDLGLLLDLYWEDQVPVDVAAVTMATRCSINMYRRTPGA
jgi:hypothetical protein